MAEPGAQLVQEVPGGDLQESQDQQGSAADEGQTEYRDTESDHDVLVSEQQFSSGEQQPQSLSQQGEGDRTDLTSSTLGDLSSQLLIPQEEEAEGASSLTDNQGAANQLMLSITEDEDQVSSCGAWSGTVENVISGEAVTTSDQETDVAPLASENQETEEVEQLEMEEVHSNTVDSVQPESMETEDVDAYMNTLQVEVCGAPAIVQDDGGAAIGTGTYAHTAAEETTQAAVADSTEMKQGPTEGNQEHASEAPPENSPEKSPASGSTQDTELDKLSLESESGKAPAVDSTENAEAEEKAIADDMDSGVMTGSTEESATGIDGKEQPADHVEDEQSEEIENTIEGSRPMSELGELQKTGEEQTGGEEKEISRTDLKVEGSVEGLQIMAVQSFSDQKLTDSGEAAKAHPLDSKVTVDTVVLDGETEKEIADVGPKTGTGSTVRDSVKGNKAPGSKKATCIVCKKVGKCKYNIVRNGDIKHLCDDTCFKRFRAKPANYLHGQKDEGLCNHCQTPIPDDVIGKFELKVGQVFKHFCKGSCLADFKKGYKTCAYCSKPVLGETEAFLAPVNNDGSFKDFCSQPCLQKYEAKHRDDEDDVEIVGTSRVTKSSNHTSFRLSKSSSSNSTKQECSVCGKLTMVKHEVNYEGKMHRLCSDPCFAAFRYANKLTLNTCDNCGVVCYNEGTNPQTIHFEGKIKRFCSVSCIENFKKKRQKVVQCAWCGTKKSNFDMIERVDANSKFQLFCTLNCLSLYRVNLQATSNQNIGCDSCHKFLPAQYHLTMSDASVRNFCSYPCVMSFQSQFSQPAGGKGSQKGSIGTVTPASPNTSSTRTGSRQSARGNGAPVVLQTSPTTSGAGQGGGCHMAQGAALIQNTQTVGLINGTGNGTRMPKTLTKKRRGRPPKNRYRIDDEDGATSSTSDHGRRSMRQHKLTSRYKEFMEDEVAARQASTPTPSTRVPVISNVVSLAPTPIVTSGASKTPLPGSQTINVSAPKGKFVSQGQSNLAQQIVIQPPQPKQMKNKSLLCKPFTQTKATSCRPHSTTKETQTDGDGGKPVLVPVPVPVYIPVPMRMYSVPTPYPLPIPVPIPVPCFIPTTKKSADSILKHVKDIQERIPADPFEAELLMMAEAVATETKSESETSDEEETASLPPDNMSTTGPQQGAEFSEDMLQMALRMASEMPDEPVLDLEDQLNPTPIQPAPAEPVQHVSTSFSTIDQESELLTQQRANPGKRGRKRRARISTGSRSKRARPEEQIQVQDEAVPEVVPPQPPPDENMVLKYTYGVNAWKHWVLQKNSALEKVSATRGKLKTFKTDLLQCTADELNYSLCLFVKEVRKPNGEEYAPDSIYYLCLGIQQYLYENGRIDNIFTDIYYEKFTEYLNEVLQKYEVRLNAQGLIVCRIEEEHLWECKQLGAHSPHVLLNTLVFFNTKFFMLKSVDDHLRLSFSHIMKHWKKTNVPGSKTQGRSVYLRYYAPVQDGTSKRKREEVPVFEQGENVDNPLRCPVKLYEFYLSKCPESIKNRNDVFYLTPERSCVPDSPVWYATSNLSAEPMSKMLHRIRWVREIQEAQLHHQPIYMP